MIQREVNTSQNEQMILSLERNRSRDAWDCRPVEFERPRKRVRISCSEPVVHRYDIPGETNLFVNIEEGKATRKTNRTWLTRQELKYFRSCATKLCRAQRLDDLLQHAYYEATTMEYDAKGITANALAKNDSYVAQRGLERLSSTHHALVRSVKIVEVRTAVFLEQTSQFLTGRRNPSLLAKVSQEASKSSQQFAQFLASADAAVAMEVRKEHLVSLQR